METISWDATKADYKLISKIAKRACGKNYDIDYMQLNMDLTATHCNGNELQLDALYQADDFNFDHDIYGILANIDRNTGKLNNCFLPRFSA